MIKGDRNKGKNFCKCAKTLVPLQWGSVSLSVSEASSLKPVDLR